MSGGDAPAECVVNISEGRDVAIIDQLRQAGGPAVLDVHTDPEHHRTVLTLGGPLPAVEAAARRVVATAVARLDLRGHTGVHPRLGVADVIPFVPLPSPAGRHSTDPPPSRGSRNGAVRLDVIDARNSFALWAGTELGVPCFLYGPERTLPDIRRLAFHPLRPDTGPPEPHPTAGASAVGARDVLVAYNIWIAGPQADDPGAGRSEALSVSRRLAGSVRSAAVRSLGLAVGPGAQVSLNLVDPEAVDLARLYDDVAAGAGSSGCRVLRAELVGLVPAAVRNAVPRARWRQLDLDGDRTIEGRLAATW